MIRNRSIRGIGLIAFTVWATSAVGGPPVRVEPVSPGVSGLRIGASFEATLVRDGADRTLEVSLGPGGTRLSLLLRSAGDKELLRLGWYDGHAFAKLPAGGDALHAIHVEGFDCEAWRLTGWQSVLDATRDEAVAGFDAGIARPSTEQIEALSLVAVLADLTRLACDEQGPPELPEANGCYYDNRDSFYACQACCESESGVQGTACGVGGAYVCAHVGSWWCGPLAGGACDGLTTLSESYCVNRNCRGLPGDGACPDPKPACGGLCMDFCGIGWDTSCGKCPGPGDPTYKDSCCT